MGETLSGRSDEGTENGAARQQRAREAIAAIRSGRTEVFSQLVEVYQVDIMTLAVVLTRNAGAAEELAHDAFVRAYQHLGTFDNHRPFYPWLAKITYRLAQTRRQQRARDLRLEHAALGQSEETPVEEDPLTTLIANEHAGHIWRAVQALPEGERVSALLYYRDGMSIRQIAQAMGVAAGTVKTYLLRARRHLAAALRLLNEEALEGNRR